jgi:hypothetical protein
MIDPPVDNAAHSSLASTDSIYFPNRASPRRVTCGLPARRFPMRVVSSGRRTVRWARDKQIASDATLALPSHKRAELETPREGGSRPTGHLQPAHQDQYNETDSFVSADLNPKPGRRTARPGRMYRKGPFVQRPPKPVKLSRRYALPDGRYSRRTVNQ